MVRLVEVVLDPGKRTCPPLATPAGASRLRCVPPPRLHRGGGAGGITPLQGTPALVDALGRHWFFDPSLNLVTFSHAGSVCNRAWLAASRFFQRLNRIKNLLRKNLNRSRRGCGNLGKR